MNGSDREWFNFVDGFWVQAEGARRAFVTCDLCGATVTNDPGSFIHRRWHESQGAAIRPEVSDG